MMIVGLVLCLIIWCVMQGGNAAFGKIIGTLMGCGVLLLPLIAIACISAAVVIPLIFASLPVIVSFGTIVYIVVMYTGKRAKKRVS